MDSALFNIFIGTLICILCPVIFRYLLSSALNSQPLHQFYRKAWGNAWPVRSGTLTKDEIGLAPDDEELFGVEIGPGVQGYLCLEHIKLVAKALRLATNVQDILVLRKQYTTILSMLIETSQGKERIVVLTGQPGIGKTTFLLFILLHRLQRRLPTAVQVNAEQFIIFDECGVSVYDAKIQMHQDNTLCRRLSRCWALCDSNQNLASPCLTIQLEASFVIITSAPQPHRWQGLLKQMGGTVSFLRLPNVMDSIGAVIKELQLDTEQTLSLVSKWGPSVRTVLRILQDPTRASRYESDVKDAAQALARADYSQVFFQSQYGLLPTLAGSDLVFVDTDPDSQFNHECSILIPTAFLRNLVVQASMNLSAEKAFDLFCTLGLSSHSLPLSSAGWSHEKATYERLITF
ncbi:hypothetical protein R3P38DRAFT_2890280 [Favolaschia claudopus]|uniref:AAA+ ATPase domain-containing protein n=1 Tax=Favolaschia claudopus TaxID=2862362 RepID=A0AAW0CWI2_9AGAR